MTSTMSDDLARPSAGIIAALLNRQEVAVEPEPLERARRRVEADVGTVRPVEWLRQVLAEAGVKDVQPVQLGWHRLDQRRLPVLVRHQDRWWVATRDERHGLVLHAESGDAVAVDEASLQEAEVLWLRVRRHRPTGEGRTLVGNLAARLVLRELFREPGWLPKVLVATVIINLLAVSTSLFAMQVYDRVVPTLAYATLTTLVAAMALIVALDWTLKRLRARILDSVACAVDRRVSAQVFDHLLRLRLDTQPRSLGTLAAQVSSLDAVRQFFSAGVVFALVDLPFALMFIVFIAAIGGKVAWVYAALLPVALLLGLIAQHRIRALLREQTLRQHERQGLLVDTIRGSESIRASHAGWRFVREWQGITDSIDAHGIQQRAISSTHTVSTSSLSTVAYVAAVTVGVWQIEAGLLTMGGLIACSILGGRVIAPIAQSAQHLVQWQHVAQALRMVHQVLSLETERRPGQELLLPDSPPDSLALEGVRFAYPESPVKQVDVASLDFRAGERVLLVGPVGCGKSTLLKLLAGLYKPGEGRIRLGDADLWEIDPQVVSQHLGYLPQAVRLFKGTLRSNLALSGGAADERVLAVSRTLGIDRIAGLSPQGMDLPISEGGDGLSGGQRQLVALGRVMVDRPRIWLLDEPTASLDGDSERHVWKALQAELREEDILIVATHRPMPAMALATRVIVMQQGEIMRDGPPEAVMPRWMGQGGRGERRPGTGQGQRGAYDVV
ncbi:ATP-binding cassette domain-containing protein [Halomonas organivorans]